MTVCSAQREGDEMACGRCGLRWEVADTNPPACLQHERRSRPRGPMAERARALALVGVTPHPIATPAPTAAPPAGALDVEAVAWAYRKLVAFGVGAVNEDSALMMDRLNLMLLGQ